MDVLGIIVMLIVVVMMFCVSFYVFVVYCHPEDRGIGISLGSRVLIVFCQGLAWGQLLLIPLDVGNSLTQDHTDSVMGILYPIVFIVNFVLSAWVIPFAVFLYETDEEDEWLFRFAWSGLFAIGITLIWCGVVFVSYVWLSEYVGESGEEDRLSIPLYIMMCLSFVGWMFLAINGGIGLIFLPFDLIVKFFHRPKKRTSDEGYLKKLFLQKRSTELINVGEELQKKEKEWRNYEGNWLWKRKLESQIKSSLEYYKKEMNQLEEQKNLFYDQLKIKQPKIEKSKKKDTKIKKQVKEQQNFKHIHYYASLIMGVLACFLSLIWLIQLIGTTTKNGGIPIFTFIDPVLSDLAEGNFSFLTIGFYSLMVLYLQGCAVKGNLVFGLRIPYIINYHPMKPNKTYLNSYLFNVNMMMLTSVATTQLTIFSFPTFLADSYLGKVFEQAVFHLPMFGWFYRNHIFMGMLVIVSFMSIFAMIYRIFRLCKKKKEKEELLTMK